MAMPLAADSSGQLPDDSQETLAQGAETPDERRERLLTGAHVRASIAKVARSNGVAEADIEDVIQETLLRALRANLPDDDRQARKYINGIAANVARDRFDELVKEATEPYLDQADEEIGLGPTPVAAQPARFDDGDAVRKVVDIGMARFPRTFPWFLRSRVLEETAEEIANDHAVQPSHVRHEISVVQSFVQAAGRKMGVAVALLVLLVMGITAWLRRPFDMRELNTYEARRVEPPAPDADRLRELAKEAYGRGAWEACIYDLDAADKLDPVGAKTWSAVRNDARSRLAVREMPKEWQRTQEKVRPWVPKGP